jgi:hypothetical protein
MIGQTDRSHPALNLVASDLFFGLGAVLLVVVAALSLGLREMVTQIVADRTADPDDTRQAVAALGAAFDGPVLLADDQGLHRMSGQTSALIALDALWTSDQLPDWLAENPLLIVALSGQEVAFLTFARAAETHPAPLATLRLTDDCHAIRQEAQHFLCLP